MTTLATHTYPEYKTTERQVQCQSLNWHIRTTGSGPLCLLVHGTGASVHSWANLAPLLAEHYTVVMVDLPGHAQTITPNNTDLTLIGMADALFHLIEQEQLHSHMMIGHSAGAAILMQLCLEHPECTKRLVSINAAVIPLQGLASYLFAPLARVSAAGDWMPRFFSYRAKNNRNIKKLLDSTGSIVDEASFERYAELFRDTQHVSGVLRMMANWRLESLNVALSRLTIPVLLIAATGDKTIPLRDTYKLQQRLPTDIVSLAIVKGFGHLVHEENPQAVAKLILNPNAPDVEHAVPPIEHAVPPIEHAVPPIEHVTPAQRIVIPAQAGIHDHRTTDSRLRGNDDRLSENDK